MLGRLAEADRNWGVLRSTSAVANQAELEPPRRHGRSRRRRRRRRSRSACSGREPARATPAGHVRCWRSDPDLAQPDLMQPGHPRRVRDDQVEPAVEGRRIAEPRQLAPRRHERLLSCVRRVLIVEENRPGEAIAAVDPRREEGLESRSITQASAADKRVVRRRRRVTCRCQALHGHPLPCGNSAVPPVQMPPSRHRLGLAILRQSPALSTARPPAGLQPPPRMVPSFSAEGAATVFRSSRRYLRRRSGRGASRGWSGDPTVGAR